MTIGVGLDLGAVMLAALGMCDLSDQLRGYLVPAQLLVRHLVDSPGCASQVSHALLLSPSLNGPLVPTVRA